MQTDETTRPTRIVPIVRFRLATIIAWTLLVIITAIWECSDNMEFKTSTARAIARASSGVDVSIIMAELEHATGHSNVTHVAIIAVIWLMGLAGIWFGFRRINSATAALMAERDNLVSVFDATPMPMLLFDDRMEAVRVNAAFRDYCIDYDALPDKRCGSILRCVNALVEPEGCGNSPACDSCRLMRTLREVSRSGLPGHGETTFSRVERDGSALSLSLLYSVEAVFFNGKSHAVMSFMDISERKRMEVKLMAREQEFRSLAETLPDNIARYDRDCRILYVNPALEETLGMPLEAIVGKIPTEVPPAGQYNDYQAELGKVLASGVDSEMEMLFPDGQGGILYHHIKLVAERDHEGAIIGALTIGRDITEFKRLREQQAAHEREFRALVENSPDFIVRYDHLCHRLYVNPAMERLVGESASRLLGKAPSEAFVATTEGGRRVQDAVEQVLDQGQPLEIELEWKVSGGHKRHFLSHFVPEFDANGNVASVLSITRDITMLRTAEAQLQHVQMMESIGLLAGGVAHDFNNILSVIGGYAELLKLTIKDNEEKFVYVQEITASVNRGAELTRSLLTFSGKHEPQKQYDNINLIVSNLQKSMSRLLRSDINLSFGFCDDQLPVLADRVQIEQIVINLMVNARDALTSGGTIHVTTARVDVRENVVAGGATLTPGSYALVTVADNGVGMDTETAARIFEPFFTTKESGKGTGLGLAIVFSIVGNHGGHISVESAPGNGSVFSIYLPIFNGSMQAKNLHEPESAKLRGRETILLADDEPNLLMMTGKMLARYGYTVLTAANGLEALQVFEAHRDEIQVVITDMIMPGMNGLEAIKRIRQQKPDLPIILTSGYTDVVFDDPDILFLPKPVHFKKLAEMLRAVLGGELISPTFNNVCPEQCRRGDSGEFAFDGTDQISPVPVFQSGDFDAEDWL